MILGIETSGDISSVALVERGHLHLERFFASRMMLNQLLAPQLEQMCGLPLSEAGIRGIAVGIGPGSFTGVRMGVAVAKALAHALELPLVGVSAPEAMATSLGVAPHHSVCVLQTARGNEVYMTPLVIGESRIARELATTGVLRLMKALKEVREELGRVPDHVCGDAAQEHCGTIRDLFENTRVAHERCNMARASDLAIVGESRLAEADPAAAFDLRPRYVRLSQAEREYGIDLELR